MEIMKISKENCNKLESYWRKISKGIPYFFEVDKNALGYSLLEGRKYGEVIFNYLESYLIEENNEVLGFIQFGKPHIYWDTTGDKVYDPNIGVIRNIYFNEDRVDAGKLLLNKAEEFLKSNNFDECFAFNHSLGLSCNAYHGKLHESKEYIADLLKDYGYKVEHENIYYSIDLSILKQIEIDENIKVLNNGVDENNIEVINLLYKNKKIGESIILYLDNLNIAYMNTIWVDNNNSSKGFGSQFIRLISDYLLKNGYKRLDLDTAKNNFGAQKFYERNGFTNEGITRSYFK